MCPKQTHLATQVNALWRALQAAPHSTRLREAYVQALRTWRLTTAIQAGRVS